MKIKVYKSYIEKLKKTDELIQSFLKMDFKNEEVDYTEENLKKITETIEEVNSFGRNSALFKASYAKIISSDGTELIRI